MKPDKSKTGFHQNQQFSTPNSMGFWPPVLPMFQTGPNSAMGDVLVAQEPF